MASRRQLKPHQLGKTGRACKVNLKTKAAIVVMVIVSAFAAASVATAAPDSGPATYVFKTFSPTGFETTGGGARHRGVRLDVHKPDYSRNASTHADVRLYRLPRLGHSAQRDVRTQGKAHRRLLQAGDHDLRALRAFLPRRALRERVPIAVAFELSRARQRCHACRECAHGDTQVRTASRTTRPSS